MGQEPDFAALDEQQTRLRTDLLLSYQKEYVYRTGDRSPLPENGCTLDEATVALACAKEDLGYCMTAKREVSKLYEDIKQPPYTVLFNSSVSALRLWRCVEVMRGVDVVLKDVQSITEGKNRLISIHGNRFVLYLVFRELGHAVLDEQNSDVSPTMATLPGVARSILSKVVSKTLELYPNAYPSNLFKNVTKCKVLAGAVSAVGLAGAEN